MTEAQYFEIPCTRGVSGNSFIQGVQDYPFTVGAPNAWLPKKSYFRITMKIVANPIVATASAYQQDANTPLFPNQLTALADNAAGNLWDNCYFRAGQQDVSSCIQYAAQASALKVRLHNTLPWLKSMGSGVAANESSFGKRVMAVSQWPQAPAVSGNPNASITQTGFYEEREMFKPYLGIATGATPVNFATSTVAIAAATGLITATLTDFTTGMPGQAGGGSGSSPAGGPVLPGDILVVNGISYVIANITAGTGVNCGSVSTPLSNNAVATTDWFIVRADTVRAPQSFNTVYVLWQPPLGIFDWDDALGAGDYRIQLNPNTNFQRQAVESKDPNYVSVQPYTFSVEDVRFYGYMEKKSIPDAMHTIRLTEMSVQSKQWGENLQFSVPPSTFALTIFIQDNQAGSSPLIPPSMFKLLGNQDLFLQQIQLTYANINKPSTNWPSAYLYSTSTVGAPIRLTGNAILELQQRYHDSYEESGLDVGACGCETFTDWLRRGPFFHFAFDRDVESQATEVQVNTVYAPSAQRPPNDARLFIVAHYRKTAQIATKNGLIISVSTREV